MEDFELSDIENVWLSEKSERGLSDLPEDFYEKCGNFAGEVRREIRESEDLRRELLEEEFKHVLSMVQEVYLIRILKITNTLFEEERKRLLEEERQAFDEIKKQLENLQEKLIRPVIEGELELKPPKEISNISIMLLKDIPEPIAASDLNYYGPFKNGDIANLPQRSAELLVGQGLAKRVQVKRGW